MLASIFDRDIRRLWLIPIMKIIGYNYSFFNKTQFVIFMSVVSFFFLLWMSIWIHLWISWNDHIMHEKVHTVTQTVVKTVYKDKIVTKNVEDATAFGGAMVEIKTDNEIKGEDLNGKLLKDICPNGVRLIDALMDGKPLIQCNQ